MKKFKSLKEMIDDVCVNYNVPPQKLAAMQLMRVYEISKAQEQHHCKTNEVVMKWNQATELPPKHFEDFSKTVLVYDIGLDFCSIGWYDYELMQWSYIGENELFVTHWTLDRKSVV